jgi:hypothetical protein
MYVVLVDHKSREAMTDLMAAILIQFPHERFSISGSDDRGFQFRIEGLGDEKLPRAFAKIFLKNWKAKLLII